MLQNARASAKAEALIRNTYDAFQRYTELAPKGSQDLIINLLAMGGEGATLINQARLAAQVLASAAEMIAAFAYVRTVKKLLTAK